jgi:hypothetical protein
MRPIFVPQLDAKDVNAVLRKYRYKLPTNCARPVRLIKRWFLGKYYGYGARDLWIPLNFMGGIATKPWHGHTVKFPARIDKQLRAMLEQKRKAK